MNTIDENQNDKGLIRALSSSSLFREFASSYNELTGLALALRPVETWQLPYRGKPNENPFCALMAQWSKTCACCLQALQRLSEAAMNQPATVICPSGMVELAVPIILGNKTIGFLQTGQVFRRAPTEARFRQIAERLAQCNGKVDLEKIQKVYFSTRVLPPQRLQAIMQLLQIFSQQLAFLSNQIILSQTKAEPVIIHKAKQYIQDHYMEELSLTQVAKAVNISTFYFCKIFKKYTGLNFTEYVSRVRIEKAKNLAMNPNLRISDIAYEVGFQSLTHFNRVFKRITGMSPTEYRSKLLLR